MNPALSSGLLRKVSILWRWIIPKCTNIKFIGLLLLYSILTYSAVYFIKSRAYPERIICPINDNIFDPSADLSKAFDDQILQTLDKADFLTFSDRDKWVEVSNNVFLYSAYVSPCPRKLSSISLCVQFVGLTFSNATDSSFDLKCALTKDLHRIEFSHAYIEVLKESHSRPYSAAFFYCEIRGTAWPSYGTVFAKQHSQWVAVKRRDVDADPPINLSVCVRPFYGQILGVHLMQFAAYYSVMGVNHFIFYNNNSSQLFEAFFNILQARNISIETHNWNIPLNNDQLHEYGQIAFTQDCIIRSRYKFSHTLVVDIDEFIVPKKHANITDLVVHLDETYDKAGSYLFANVMFCDEYSDSSACPFQILKNVRRQKTPWYYEYRSKYIVKPHRVHMSGIHFMWELENDFEQVEVPYSTGMLHHYKPCCLMVQTYFFHIFEFNVLDDAVLLDKSLYKIADNFLHHRLIEFVFGSVFNSTVCDF